MVLGNVLTKYLTRLANLNVLSSKSYMGILNRLLLWLLEFICALEFVICYLKLIHLLVLFSRMG